MEQKEKTELIVSSTMMSVKMIVNDVIIIPGVQLTTTAWFDSFSSATFLVMA